MNSIQAPTPRLHFRKRYVAALVVLGLLLACSLGIASYFRLSSDSQALRSRLMSSVPGQWHKKFAIHVGWPTMTVVRAGSRLFNMPPQPRAVLDALHGAEVGIYNLEGELALPDFAAVFRAADKAMVSRGWTRVIGVAREAEFVAAYIPSKGISARKMACCVVVLHDRQLVIASAQANVELLMAIASERFRTDSRHDRIFAGR